MQIDVDAPERLMPLVSFVKIGVQLTAMVRVSLPQKCKAHRVRMVAEKVETRDVFEATRFAVKRMLTQHLPCTISECGDGVQAFSSSGVSASRSSCSTSRCLG